MKFSLLTASAALLSSAQAYEIAFAGDSWASFSKSLFTQQNICGTNGGVALKNGGIAGSTVLQWATNRKPWWAFGSKAPMDFYKFTKANHYWVSLGGNDVLDQDCSNTNLVSQIEQNLLKVIRDIIAEEPSAKILLTGYAKPSCVKNLCPGTTFEGVKVAFYNVAKAFPQGVVTLTDVSYEFGATSSPDSLSDKKWYQDCIHLNSEGYRKLFSLPAFKSFFCESAANSAASREAPAGAEFDEMFFEDPQLQLQEQLDAANAEIAELKSEEEGTDINVPLIAGGVGALVLVAGTAFFAGRRTAGTKAAVQEDKVVSAANIESQL